MFGFSPRVNSLHSKIKEKGDDLKIVSSALSAMEGLTTNASNLEVDSANLLSHISSAYQVAADAAQISAVTSIVDYLGYSKTRLTTAKDTLESEIAALGNEVAALMLQELRGNDKDWYLP